MIAYFDTSAFVPLLISESGTALAQELWLRADDLASCRLLHLEAAAALARAHRLGRISAAALRPARRPLPELLDQMDLLEVNATLVDEAVSLTSRHDLRGYDAVQCAAAALLKAEDVTVLSGDRDLLRTCRALDLAVVDTSGS